MSTHNLCFEQKYEKKKKFEYFQFLVMKFSVYLNRRVFVMVSTTSFLCDIAVLFSACLSVASILVLYSISEYGKYPKI